MKEIKFRAWDKERKTMCGDFMHFAEDAIYRHDSNPWHDSRFILMQFTGLKDKNGKEIYEGDVCKYWMGGRWKVGDIVWQRGGWAIHVRKYGEDPLDIIFEFQHFIPCPDEGDTMQDQFEVIGNIYEDPELLT
jgi:hypothetical protein